MYVVIGHTYKGEQFAIGHTASRKKAQKYMDAINEGNDEEYAWAEALYSRQLGK